MDTPIYTTKRELAQAYAPGMSYDSAQKRLVRWINCNPNLVAELKAHDYKHRQRKLTAEQLKIIFKYLGEP